MVFVVSGSVSFETDPNSGSSPSLICIRIPGNDTESTDPEHLLNYSSLSIVYNLSNFLETRKRFFWLRTFPSIDCSCWRSTYSQILETIFFSTAIFADSWKIQLGNSFLCYIVCCLIYFHDIFQCIGVRGSICPPLPIPPRKATS